MNQPPIASTSSKRAAPCHSRVRRGPFGQAVNGYYQRVGYRADDVPGRFTLEVTATPARLPEIRHRVAEWLATIEVTEQVGTDVVLTVNEACTNCIEHAYRGVAAGPIRIEATHTCDHVTLRVSDFGTWKPPDARLSTRGRGLLMMSAMSYDLTVDQSHDGTTVTMTYAIA